MLFWLLSGASGRVQRVQSCQAAQRREAQGHKSQGHFLTVGETFRLEASNFKSHWGHFEVGFGCQEALGKFWLLTGSYSRSFLATMSRFDGLTSPINPSPLSSSPGTHSTPPSTAGMASWLWGGCNFVNIYVVVLLGSVFLKIESITMPQNDILFSGKPKYKLKALWRLVPLISFSQLLL